MSVHALARSKTHDFTKKTHKSLNLITGLGVEGDCHAGEHVQHRSRLQIRPKPPNLRQVHLITLEMLEYVGVSPGQLGENVTTSGIDLLALGRGDLLHFVSEGKEDKYDEEKGHAVVRVTGLRNPCHQIEKFQKGLQEQFIVRDETRKIVGRLAGIMGVVEAGGPVKVGMSIVVEPVEVYEELECV